MLIDIVLLKFIYKLWMFFDEISLVKIMFWFVDKFVDIIDIMVIICKI